MAGRGGYPKGYPPYFYFSSSECVHIVPTAQPTNTSLPGSQWRYEQIEDQMAKGVTYTAAVRSKNTVNFKFPYAGEQRATLTLRFHPRHGRDVILSIERGQLLCRSYSGCGVLVRFDEAKAIKFAALPPADHSNESIFIQNFSGFAKRLAESRKVRISADVYHEGELIFEFDVSHFDGNKIKLK